MNTLGDCGFHSVLLNFGTKFGLKEEIVSMPLLYFSIW